MGYSEFYKIAYNKSSEEIIIKFTNSSEYYYYLSDTEVELSTERFNSYSDAIDFLESKIKSKRVPSCIVKAISTFLEGRNDSQDLEYCLN